MARKPRIVVDGQPLHVIQRGKDRQAPAGANVTLVKGMNKK